MQHQATQKKKMCFSGACVNDVTGVTEFTYVSALWNFPCSILMTNDNNSKILRLIPAPSTRIKELSKSSVARPPGHGRDYFLSFLSNASTLQQRQPLLWAHRGLQLAHLSSKRQGDHCYQLITACGAGHLCWSLWPVERGDSGRGWFCSFSPSSLLALEQEGC